MPMSPIFHQKRRLTTVL